MFNKIIQLMVLVIVTHFSFSTRANQVETKQVIIKAQDNQINGGIPIDIPDGDATGVNIDIDATGFFTGNIENLTLILEINHTWVGDLQVTLYAPNDIAKLVIFSNKGYSRDDPNGDGSDLNGVYEFNDSATKDFWVEGANSGLIPPGSYRTSTAGNTYSYFGGCTTRLKGAFAGLTPAQTNGVWRLHVADIAGGDLGQINNFDLLTDLFAPDYTIFNNSFESPSIEDYSSIVVPAASDLQGNCKKAQYDFTGSGVSDYVTYWTGENNTVVQIVGNNGPGANTGASYNTIIGQPPSNVQITSGGDFDGDGITDIVTYEPSAFNSQWNKYSIRRSSRIDDTPMYFHARFLNLTNIQIGDYNGDGIDELAWYINRHPEPDGLLDQTYAIRLDDTPTGVNKRIAGGFDHNGDGIDDFVVFFVDGMGTGNQTARAYNGSNGDLLYNWPNSFHSLSHHLPGNFNPSDFNLSGLGYYAPLGGSYYFGAGDMNTQTILINDVVFGVAPTDIPLTGDYDGDGVDDFGVWRPNTDSQGNRFVIRPSSDPGNFIEVSPLTAEPLDYPVANSRLQ